MYSSIYTSSLYQTEMSCHLHAPHTQYTGVWVSPRAGLDVVEKMNKKFCPCQELNPDALVIQSAT
jgi:hypothetical protein